MPTNITQTESDGRLFLRVEGELYLDDAILLERIIDDIRLESDQRITIDLADLDLLDSDSAPTLMRLELRPDVDIQGMDIFLQTAIDAAERSPG